MQEMTQSEVDVEITDKGDEKIDRDDDSPIIKLVSLIIADAYKLGASDIHLEPMER